MSWIINVGDNKFIDCTDVRARQITAVPVQNKKIDPMQNCHILILQICQSEWDVPHEMKLGWIAFQAAWIQEVDCSILYSAFEHAVPN